MRLYWLLIVVCLIFGCKNSHSNTKVRLDSMLKLHIEVEQGENIIPIYKDTIEFLGLPGSIGLYEDNKELPFLVLGKELEKDNEYLCHFIGSITVKTAVKDRIYGIALPINEEFRTIDVDSYDNLTQSQPMLKLWLKDYFTFAFGKEMVRKVEWQNEIEILRKINREE